MAYQFQESCEEIDAAKRAVAQAMRAHSKGGSLDAVNAANRRLADAYAKDREVWGGNVPDTRGRR